MYNARITETIPLAGGIQTSGSTGSWFTDAIPLNGDQGKRFRHLINVPTLSGGATVDYGVYLSATSGGSYAALAGASIATESAGNKLFQIELEVSQILNAVPGMTYMKGYLKVGTASASPSVIVEGAEAEQRPTTDNAAHVQTANTVYC